MSLNWREIDAVLDEAELAGTHVQQVIQPDFRNLYLEIFRPGNRFYLRICFETGKTRIHTTDRKPQKPPVRQRFAQLLHSRITGGRIVAARQLNSDRIIRIDVERASERTILWIRLWGGAANCIVTDEEGAVIDAFFRRPGKGEVTGGSYFVEEQEPAPSQREKLDTFTSRWADSINEQVREHYAALEQQERYERAREQAEATLRSQIGSVRRRLSQLNGKQGDTEDADRYQTLGDLILANLYRIESGASWIEVEDYTRENEPVTIELDPAKSPQANAERYFDRAQKARGKRDAFADEIANLEQRLERLEREEADLDSRPTDELRAIVEEFAPVGKGRNEGAQTPGLRFESSGFTILVGRNARENDALLRRFVRGNDVWLHTRDFPGGYVFVKSRRGKSVPLDVLLDAGNLAIHYSRAKTNGRADLYYTQVKFLRRAKDGPKGLVLPTQEKNLHVVTDEDRVARLLGPRGA